MAGLKRCTRCEQFMLPELFHKRASRCKPCAREVTREWRRDHPDQVATYRDTYKGRYAGSKTNGYRLKYRYGISLAEHQALLDRQGGKCAICECAFTKTPHVDHCHDTGKVRGLLCDLCNRGLGYFKDNAVVFEAAAKYLRMHS